MRKIKFPHSVITKAPYLLPMKYKVSELAKELDIPKSTLRGWLQLGAPFERDHRNHIYIVGPDFAAWVEKVRKKKASGRRLKDDEAYCFSCRKPVQLVDPITISNQGKLVHFKGKCPECGNVIFRGGRNAETN